jgi:hypothetical protein
MTFTARLMWSSEARIGYFLYDDFTYGQGISALEAACNAERIIGNPTVTKQTSIILGLITVF